MFIRKLCSQMEIVKDEAGRLEPAFPGLPCPVLQVQAHGCAVVNRLNVGCQTAFAVVVGMAEDEFVGGGRYRVDSLHIPNMAGWYAVASVGGKNKNTSWPEIGAGLAAFLLAGKPGQGSVLLISQRSAGQPQQ